MGKSKRFEDTEFRQYTRFLVREVYLVSRNPLFSSDYALRDQIRRAAVSIASNIAEGFDSQSNAVTCRYLASARGSASEVRAQLYLAFDFEYISKPAFEKLIPTCKSVSRQLTGFIAYFRKMARTN